MCAVAAPTRGPTGEWRNVSIAAPDPDYAEARYFAGLVALTSEW
jgi:hypothetical protein